jgi:ArsR family transcriptional regulator, arsenate/arsenite/antimonite-responsive transcriptional repressor
MEDPQPVADPEKQARIFKVLSVSTRVRMIEMLKDRTLCVNALARLLDITPAAVSQHLRILRDAEIVVPDKRGYFVHYRINEETLAEWNRIASGLLRRSTTLVDMRKGGEQPEELM